MAWHAHILISGLFPSSASGGAQPLDKAAAQNLMGRAVEILQ